MFEVREKVFLSFEMDGTFDNDGKCNFPCLHEGKLFSTLGKLCLAHIITCPIRPNQTKESMENIFQGKHFPPNQTHLTLLRG